MFNRLSALLAFSLLTAAGSSSGMNKGELVDAIAKDAGLSKADAGKAIGAFEESTASALKKGDRVALVGFGSFSISKRASRAGRNPQTGKEIKIKATKSRPDSAEVTLSGSSIELGDVIIAEDESLDFALQIPEFLLSAGRTISIEAELDNIKIEGNDSDKDEASLLEVELSIPEVPLSGAAGFDAAAGSDVYEVSLSLLDLRDDDVRAKFEAVMIDMRASYGPPAATSSDFDAGPLFSSLTVAFQADFTTNECAGPLLAGALDIPAGTYAGCNKVDVTDDKGKSLYEAAGKTDYEHAPEADCDDDTGRLESEIKKVRSAITDALETDNATASSVYDALLNAGPTLRKIGDHVALVGFGSFSISTRAARTGRNPQTGKEIKIAAKNVAKFKAGRAISDVIVDDTPPITTPGFCNCIGFLAFCEDDNDCNGCCEAVSDPPDDSAASPGLCNCGDDVLAFCQDDNDCQTCCDAIPGGGDTPAESPGFCNCLSGLAFCEDGNDCDGCCEAIDDPDGAAESPGFCSCGNDVLAFCEDDLDCQTCCDAIPGGGDTPVESLEICGCGETVFAFCRDDLQCGACCPPIDEAAPQR